MPYLHCENTKQKMKVSIEVCFANQCPHIKGNIFTNREGGKEEELTCNFKPTSQKKVEKRKKK